MSSNLSGNVNVASATVSGSVDASAITLSGNVVIRNVPNNAPLLMTIFNGKNLHDGSIGVQLPMTPTGTYNFTVDWGDGSPVGTVTAYGQPSASHVYPDDNEYQISIVGRFTEFIHSFGNFGRRLKSVDSYGGIVFDSLSYNDCWYLTSIPAGGPPVRSRDFSSLFESCASFNHIPHLDTVGGTAFQACFWGCSTLLSIGSMDFSGGDDFFITFQNCPSLESVDVFGIRADVSFANCLLGASALNTIFSNLGTVSGKTITITGNPGAGTCNQSIATGKGWTVVN